MILFLFLINPRVPWFQSVLITRCTHECIAQRSLQSDTEAIQLQDTLLLWEFPCHIFIIILIIYLSYLLLPPTARTLTLTALHFKQLAQHPRWPMSQVTVNLVSNSDTHKPKDCMLLTSLNNLNVLWSYNKFNSTTPSHSDNGQLSMRRFPVPAVWGQFELIPCCRSIDRQISGSG